MRIIHSGSPLLDTRLAAVVEFATAKENQCYSGQMSGVRSQGVISQGSKGVENEKQAYLVTIILASR